MAVLPEVRRQLEDGDRRRLRDIAENGHDGGGRPREEEEEEETA